LYNVTPKTLFLFLLQITANLWNFFVTSCSSSLFLYASTKKDKMEKAYTDIHMHIYKHICRIIRNYAREIQAPDLHSFASPLYGEASTGRETRYRTRLSAHPSVIVVIHIYIVLYCIVYLSSVLSFWSCAFFIPIPTNYARQCLQYDGLCCLLVRVLCYRSRGPGSIPGATRPGAFQKNLVAPGIEPGASQKNLVAPGSIPGATRFFWEAPGLERGPLSLVGTIEGLLGRKNKEYGRRDPSSWPRGTLYPQKLALTSLTSEGQSLV
jgi:hypothetical protein